MSKEESPVIVAKNELGKKMLLKAKTSIKELETQLTYTPSEGFHALTVVVKAIDRLLNNETIKTWDWAREEFIWQEYYFPNISTLGMQMEPYFNYICHYLVKLSEGKDRINKLLVLLDPRR